MRPCVVPAQGTNLLVRSAADSAFGSDFDSDGRIFSAVVGWSTLGAAGALKMAVG